MTEEAKDFGVRIVRRNAKQEVISEETYSLKDYADMMRSDILRIISDVESLIYMMNEEQPKEEWPDNVWVAFNTIKHKLLDKGNEIGRIPENIVDFQSGGILEWKDIRSFMESGIFGTGST